MITFKFNEVKTTQAAALFLKKNNSKMNYMKLIKLLYLADREALSRWERPLTGDSYVSMRRGPVLSNVLDIITSGNDPSDKSYWYKYISKPSDYTLSLRAEPKNEELTKREIQLIDEIYTKYKVYDKWEMVDICHETLSEWKHPGAGAIPIYIEDILQALNKTTREIEIIASEISDVDSVRTTLSELSKIIANSKKSSIKCSRDNTVVAQY